MLTILLCWSVVIAWNLPRCQWLAAAVGALMVAWATMLPVERALLPRINSDLQTTVEEINSGSAIPGAAEEFMKAVKDGEREPAIVVTAAQAALREGKLDDAERMLQLIVGFRGLREPLLREVYVLLGSTAFHKGDLSLAKEFLNRAEELGEKRFELYFYQAQLAIASTDLTESRKILRSRQFG